MKSPPIDDTALVKLCIEELPYNTAHFQVLVKRYERLVFNVSYRFFNSVEEAEDVVQEVFINVFRSILDFNLNHH